jgi:transposase
MKITVFPNKSVTRRPLTSGRTPLITFDELCAHWLPPDDRLTLQSLRINAPRLILVAAMRSAHSTCPECRQPPQRIPGHSRRTLADFPWAPAPSELRVIVRRCRCCPCTCRRQTCAARLPTVAPRYARTTTRWATPQAHTGLVFGGTAGARHLSRHGVPGSRHTLLRRVRSVSLPEGPAPAIIGWDDGAGRKGQRYGTSIGALQRGCAID